MSRDSKKILTLIGMTCLTATRGCEEATQNSKFEIYDIIGLFKKDCEK
jgi:hypothetical protein